MGKRHLKRITTPRTWRIKRKAETFVKRPSPGAHPFAFGMPAIVVLRDYLGVAKTKKEARAILNARECLVDGRAIKDPGYIIGMMDTVSFPKVKKHYRMVIDGKGKLSIIPIDEKEAQTKICKITSKTKIKKGGMQLGFSDSRTMLVKKDSYKVGDSIVMEIPKQNEKSHLKLEKGQMVLLTGGKHMGHFGTIENIENQNIIIKSEDARIDTRKEYAFVVGKSKPEVVLAAQ